MRILVTGANGFVGAALCKKLVQSGHQVRGLVRKTSDCSLLQGVSIEKVIGSLEDTESLRKAAEQAELVYHTAAAVTDWGTYTFFRRVNVEGTRHMLDAAVASGIRRMVLVSSVVVSSFIDQRHMDENSPRHDTPFPYCRTKREAEELAMQYHRKGLIEIVIVRPGDIYGPGDRVSLLKMAPLLEKGGMAYIDHGHKTGAFTYIENLVDGLILAGSAKEAAGQAFVITDGIELTWRAYFEKLCDALEVPRPKISVPSWLALGIAAFLETLYRLMRIKARPPLTMYLVHHLRSDFHFSIRKAKQILGYDPGVGIDAAMKKTAAWYNAVVRAGKTESKCEDSA